MGSPALAGVHPDDLPRVRLTIAALQRGEIEEAKILYRNRHREKSEIWIETALRVTRRAETGTVNGVVALSRDMTEHKDLQGKLAVLAATDGLTNLANRRCFDERLEQEWARARREGTPLSLLMIDIDHFKQLNDQHGHQEGDTCLRAVAGIIAKHCGRPADLAARYGGEEFALLLPNTDANGCEQVGMRICQAIREFEYMIDDRSSSWRVTASIGAATTWPTPGVTTKSSSLVEASDRALYAAKNGGRDRLVVAGQVVPWPAHRKADIAAFGLGKGKPNLSGGRALSGCPGTCSAVAGAKIEIALGCTLKCAGVAVTFSPSVLIGIPEGRRAILAQHIIDLS